jgi:hypothetical protein
MVDLKTSESQRKAVKSYEEKNKDKVNYLKAKSSAKSFIKNKATKEDLEEFKNWINEREKQLKYD